MKDINAIETKDGKIFKTKAEAEKHQKELDFEDWYLSFGADRLCDVGDNVIEFEVMKGWLEDHKKEILKFLQPLRIAGYPETEIKTGKLRVNIDTTQAMKSAEKLRKNLHNIIGLQDKIRNAKCKPPWHPGPELFNCEGIMDDIKDMAKQAVKDSEDNSNQVHERWCDKRLKHAICDGVCDTCETEINKPKDKSKLNIDTKQVLQRLDKIIKKIEQASSKGVKSEWDKPCDHRKGGMRKGGKGPYTIEWPNVKFSCARPCCNSKEENSIWLDSLFNAM